MSEILTENQAIEVISELAKNDHVDAEVILEEDQEFKTSFQKRKLDQFSRSFSRTLGVRIIDGEREGCAFTECMGAQAIKVTYSEARTNSQFIMKSYEPEILPPQKIKQMPEIYNPKLNDVSVEDKLSMAKDLEGYSLDYDPKIAGVPYNGYFDFQSKFRIFNTKGLDIQYKSNGCGIYSHALAREGDKNGMDSSIMLSRDFNQLDAKKIAQESAQNAIQKIHAVKPETGKYPIVILNKALKNIFNMISLFFSAKAVDEKTSLLTNKLEQKIFSDKINIYDDPFYKNAFGCQPFDSEGTPSTKTILVENGVLKTYLTNSVYAKKMNLTNSANGTRSAKSELNISPSNLILASGKKSLEELVKSNPKTILIDELKGMSGFNVISGDFSIESQGALYLNGEFSKPLSNFVISGNIIDLLNTVCEVGNDPFLSEGFAITPSVLINELSIAGQAE